MKNNYYFCQNFKEIILNNQLKTLNMIAFFPFNYHRNLRDLMHNYQVVSVLPPP